MKGDVQAVTDTIAVSLRKREACNTPTLAPNRPHTTTQVHQILWRQPCQPMSIDGTYNYCAIPQPCERMGTLSMSADFLHMPFRTQLE